MCQRNTDDSAAAFILRLSAASPGLLSVDRLQMGLGKSEERGKGERERERCGW